jgi:N-glycosylase/DNA lyase
VNGRATSFLASLQSAVQLADRGAPFWSLFEKYFPETPVVDF